MRRTTEVQAVRSRSDRLHLTRVQVAPRFSLSEYHVGPYGTQYSLGARPCPRVVMSEYHVGLYGTQYSLSAGPGGVSGLNVTRATDRMGMLCHQSTMRHRPDDVCMALAGRQRSLFNLTQGRRAGLNRRAIHHRVQTGRLERFLPGVLAVPGVPDSWERDTSGLVLMYGDGSAAHIERPLAYSGSKTLKEPPSRSRRSIPSGLPLPFAAGAERSSIASMGISSERSAPPKACK
jgi:hypothetical protein